MEFSNNSINSSSRTGVISQRCAQKLIISAHCRLRAGIAIGFGPTSTPLYHRDERNRMIGIGRDFFKKGIIENVITEKNE
jgi:hypothetical protein